MDPNLSRSPNPYQAPNEPTPDPRSFAAERHVGAKYRGGCLTAFLVLMMIANPLVGLMYLVTGDTIERTLHAPDWAIPLLTVLSLVNFACAIGIWKWKKWGVFGAVAMAAIGLVVNFTIGIQPMQAILGLAGPAILIALVSKLWKQFD
jgi:hypothetical protein